jgi:hypothetical protein
MGWNPVGSLRGAQGDPGFSTIRGATDYDDSVAPEANFAPVWDTAASKWKPKGVPVLDPATGKFTNAVAPVVTSGIRSGNIGSGSYAVNQLDVNANFLSHGATADLTLGEPVGGSDHQELVYHIVAVGGDRLIFFDYAWCSGMGNTALRWLVPRGEVLHGRLRRFGNHANSSDVVTPIWCLIDAGIAGINSKDYPLPLSFGTSPGIDGRLSNYRTTVMTNNMTLNAPTSPSDGQTFRFRGKASGAQRTVTFNAALKRPSHIPSSMAVPTNAFIDVALLYDASWPAWTVMAAHVVGP